MWQNLHITDALGWLGYCFCGYAAFLVAYTFWKHRRPKHAERWMKWIVTARKLKKNAKGWAFANEFPITIILTVSFVASLGWLTFRTQYPIVEEHHIKVYRQLENGDWAMESDEEGKFAYRPCGDYNVQPMLQLAVDGGYIASHAKWEQRPTCRSIRATGLQFWWRDDNFNTARIPNADSSAR